MFEEKDDTILARWMAGMLSSEEQSKLEQLPEFKDYERIVNGLNRFEKPYFNKEALHQRIKNQIRKSSRTKVFRLRPILFATSVAASVILIIGLFFNEITYTTGVGEQIDITLPNGAKVQMNAKSELSHARFFWNTAKKVKLHGEALFKTAKGNGFNVITDLGIVSVLGTHFNVKSRTKIFEIKCYEGKVSFKLKEDQQEILLTKGELVKVSKGVIIKEDIEESEPDWLNGWSSFNNISLQEVLEELKIQYDVTIENKGVNLSKRFSGGFVHNDLSMALKTVLEPMGIKYEISKDKKRVKLLSP